jgi:hypothetical protein
MEVAERERLLQSWKTDILKERVSRLCDYGSLFNKSLIEVNALYGDKNRRIMEQKRITACTTTLAAKHVQQIQSVSPGVLLVEGSR